MIPRTIHRIWLDDPMPDEFAEYGLRWAELHPGWRVIDWRNRLGIPKLLQQEAFDAARRHCPRDWKRFQADILRLELLYRLGGIYVDTDVEPLQPIDPLCHAPCFVAWSPNRGPAGQRLLTQAVMAAVPRHPFIEACLNGIPAAIEGHCGRPLAQMIGPWHVTRTYQAGCFPDVVVHDEGVFYPQSNAERDRGRTPDLSSAYAWHRWATTRGRKR